MKHFNFRLPFVVFSISLFVVLLALYSCRKTEYTHVNNTSESYPNNPQLPPQTYVYPNGDNNLATLGRVLFYDKNLSLDKSVACASCHQQAYGFADNKAFSTGFGGLQTPRNAHTIINTNNSRFWDGKVQPQTSGYENQPQTLSVPFQSHVELNMTDMSVLSNRLSALPYYQYLTQKAFGNSFLSEENIERALGSFMDNITSSNSKYDQAFPTIAGVQPTAVFTAQELNGKAIFDQKCATCHSPSNGFGGSMDQFEDIGLDASYKDLGRGTITSFSSDNGKFQVPSLKNISLTAPYMHDGRFNTLSEVVDFFSNNINSSPNLSSAFTLHPYFNGTSYSTGGTAVPMGFTPTEKSELVAFLNTLSDQGQVSDVRYSNPFKH